MPVKHWSFAGLILTYWCNAACRSCYLCCGPPQRREEMSPADALSYWRSLAAASPHGCRIHLSGGEPFGDWGRLIEVCRAAAGEGLGPLDKVETNAFWATDAAVVADRMRALDACGMRKLVISADPYHQQFVPIERCRLAARVAEQVLGGARVQVRWRDWLADGQDTDALGEPRRTELFARYAAAGRDRLNGRAAQHLAANLPFRPVGEFADNPCRQSLLRSRHVHVDAAGRVIPGTCAGIVLGQAKAQSVAEVWRRLADEHAARPIVGTLAERGPVGLLDEAVGHGFLPGQGYASKCHLCWDIRRWLVAGGLHLDELQPAWMYLDSDGSDISQVPYRKSECRSTKSETNSKPEC
jgi:hypothetical protein